MQSGNRICAASMLMVPQFWLRPQAGDRISYLSDLVCESCAPYLESDAVTASIRGHAKPWQRWVLATHPRSLVIHQCFLWTVGRVQLWRSLCARWHLVIPSAADDFGVSRTYLAECHLDLLIDGEWSVASGESRSDYLGRSALRCQQAGLDAKQIESRPQPWFGCSTPSLQRSEQ